MASVCCDKHVSAQQVVNEPDSQCSVNEFTSWQGAATSSSFQPSSAVQLSPPEAEEEPKKRAIEMEVVEGHVLPQEAVCQPSTLTTLMETAEVDDTHSGSMGVEHKTTSGQTEQGRAQSSLKKKMTKGSLILRKVLSGSAQNSSRAARVSKNKNTPQDYRWLEGVLMRLAKNEARQLGCLAASGQEAIPIFFMLGACPNAFCGMQVIMFTLCTGKVDFWWVKPQKAVHTELERSTLNLNVKGPHRNDAKSSKPFYTPLADLFDQRHSKDGWCFGIETEPGSLSRAFIEREGGDVGRLYWHVVWMEDWTSNPFARTRFIRGKIVYQKDLSVVSFCARQFSIVNGRIQISEHEEHLGISVIPSDSVKWLSDE